MSTVNSKQGIVQIHIKYALLLLKYGFTTQNINIGAHNATKALRKTFGISNEHLNALLWLTEHSIITILRKEKENTGRFIQHIHAELTAYINGECSDIECVQMPKKFAAYRNCYLECPSVDSFHTIINGTLRTLLQHHFKKYRQLHGKCNDCGRTEGLQLSHELEDRPKMFKGLAVVKKRTSKGIRFDVHRSLLAFILAHCHKDAISVKCADHHGKRSDSHLD